MQFTETEIRFLSGGFDRPEERCEGWTPIPDGMPERMRLRALEHRAKRLGKKFAEFRDRSRAAMAEVTDSLAQRIAASRLF